MSDEQHVQRLEDPLPLGVTMDPEEGTIVEVGKYRHRVQWTAKNGGELSTISYCNWCGCPFLGLATMNTLDGKLIDRDFHICPSCEAFQGWTDEYEGVSQHSPLH